MKLNLMALSLCGLTVVACGGADKTAQDPSTVNTTAAQSDSAVVTSTTTATTTDGTNLAPASGSTTDLSNRNSTLTPSVPSTTGSNSGGSATTSSTFNGAGNGSNANNNAPSGAHVTDNPGVANQTPNADNTKINDRDRHGTVTPENNGNSKNETQITAAIRRDVMADKSLSFTAKNVKIVVTGSKVTLRGVVKTDAEKSAIADHAKQAAGITEVDNQIEVKK